MTLTTLIVTIALTALILTLLVGFAFRKVTSWPVTFLQNFCGALFIFSGWVKAIDPLGTAYKMEQYFAEFESTFRDTWFSFLVPLFPRLSEYAASFSVSMIVFETVLGIMLLTGTFRKFTAWAFFLMVFFFTFLTGFTYLTGFVPEGVNFFQFGQWGPFVETNMKVTDCGCFGDFLKLPPRTSFLKDVVLLFPGLVFLFASQKMHQLFSGGTRTAILVVSIAALTLYCFSNFVWNLPHTDFRPFKEGVNVREQKIREREAEENVKILAYRMTNRSTGKVVELPFEQYLKEFKNYPKEEWNLQQIKSEPEVPHTKISDFEIADIDGNDITEDLLNYPGYSFMIVAYKLDGKTQAGIATVSDTILTRDTLQSGDSLVIQSRIDSIVQRQVKRNTYSWEEAYLSPWVETVNPVLNAARADGVTVYAITAYAGKDKIDDFRKASQGDYPFFQADDILLKTIVRSNPGIVLMKDGEIIKKWHYRQLPSYEEIKSNYMRE